MASLNFNWELVSGIRVVAVMGRNERRMDDDAFAWDEIAIVLSDKAVILSVNDDTDEVIVKLSAVPAGSDWQEVAPLKRLAMKSLGWCWAITNHRGYRDGFMVAFGDVAPDALEPKLTFLGAGSAITCLQMTSLS